MSWNCGTSVKMLAPFLFGVIKSFNDLLGQLNLAPIRCTTGLCRTVGHRAGEKGLRC